MHDSVEEVLVEAPSKEEYLRFQELASQSPQMLFLLNLMHARGWNPKFRESVVRKLVNTSLREEGVRVDIVYYLLKANSQHSQLNIQFFFVGPTQQFIAFLSTENVYEETEGSYRLHQIQSIFKLLPEGLVEYDWGGSGVLELRPYDSKLGERIL